MYSTKHYIILIGIKIRVDINYFDLDLENPNVSK